MTSNSRGTRYHVVLPNADGTAALACATDTGVALPTWSRPDHPFWEEAPAVVQGVLEQLGVPVAMLRACRLNWTEQDRDSYYVVEALDPEWQPPEGALWVDLEMIDRLTWSCAVDREVLVAWLNDNPPKHRVRWYRPGWFACVTAWLDESLAHVGLTRTGAVEQLRSWERSSIMRVATDGGRLYFKAVAPQWGHEPALTRLLADRFSHYMPEVIVADSAHGCLLVREFAGTPLPESGDLDLWIAAYAALGRVQRELVGALAELRALGVPCRDPGAILGEMSAVFADRRRMRAGMASGLTDGEIRQLQAAAPELRAACERLMKGPIPLSLDHGDFWPGNIYASNDRITLFDWSDATITHPFFSLVMAADEIADTLPDLPGAAERVLDAYLAEWSDYGTPDELRAIFDDAMLVAPLHYALMYRDVYLPAMEFIDELDQMTPHFLRWLVERVGST